MLLSIDVGIKNLAMCLLNETSLHIEEWDVDGIPPEHRDGIYVCLRNHLDARPWLLRATTILIEKQPGQNKRMKTVENFLHAYFLIKIPQATTIIYDARHKVPDVRGSGKANYRNRKNTAIVRCKDFLESNNVNSEWLMTFRQSKKKDDLADTVLQGLSYINRLPNISENKPDKKVKTKDKVNPRKPTQNQKETKYSKSNLAWLYKNNMHIVDKRFIKDLKRYYINIEELISEL
tara:strand:+ start:3060 stop:3761 length:702 start_codon:yes stop_codon:yes gene_type:complete